jgi:hypothetical protein
MDSGFDEDETNCSSVLYSQILLSSSHLPLLVQYTSLILTISLTTATSFLPPFIALAMLCDFFKNCTY